MTKIHFSEFANEARLISKDSDDQHDSLQKLVLNSLSYSACSSFAALSGNSDLEHRYRRAAAAFQDVEEGSDDDEDIYEEEDDASSDNDEENDIYSETESDESEEEDVLEHREPIDHLLKVTIFSQFKRKYKCVSLIRQRNLSCLLV